MKITKYPQSCLLLEKSGRRVLIDPGNFVAKKYKAEDFLPLDGVLVTHEHADHADKGLLRAFKEAGVRVVVNASMAEILEGIKTEVIEDGDEFELGGFEVKAHELPHCLMMDGSQGPQNTGYILDDTFFHPGDGVKISGVAVRAAAVPIAGPDVSPHDAYAFMESLGAETIIPVHYDFFIADPEFFKKMAARFDGRVRVAALGVGESLEL